MRSLRRKLKKRAQNPGLEMTNMKRPRLGGEASEGEETPEWVVKGAKSENVQKASSGQLSNSA